MTLPTFHPRIQGAAHDAFCRLPAHMQRDVLSYVDGNHQSLYDTCDVVDAYLVWNGIIGYTRSVIELVLRAYDKEA